MVFVSLGEARFGKVRLGLVKVSKARLGEVFVRIGFDRLS